MNDQETKRKKRISDLQLEAQACAQEIERLTVRAFLALREAQLLLTTTRGP